MKKSLLVIVMLIVSILAVSNAYAWGQIIVNGGDYCIQNMVSGWVDDNIAHLKVLPGAGNCKVTFSSYSHNGNIFPVEDQVHIQSITDTYGPGEYVIGPLQLACNWQTDLYFGNPVYNLFPGSLVFTQPPSGKSPADFVLNQVCPNEIPEFTTIGAGLVLAGAGAYMYRKRNRK